MHFRDNMFTKPRGGGGIANEEEEIVVCPHEGVRYTNRRHEYRYISSKGGLGWNNVCFDMVDYS